MKIAIVKLSAMGDIIHAAVVLQFIKRAYPEAVIDWIVEEAFAPVLENNPHIHAIHKVTLKRFKKNRKLSVLVENYRMLRSLKGYDCIIDMQGLLKSALVARLIGKNVCGFDKDSTREGAAALLYTKSVAADYDMNVIRRGAELVSKALGITITEADLQQKEPFLFGEKSPVGEGKILVMVGASWPSKIYPAEKMAQVAERLGKEVLLVWGSEAEKAIADAVAARTPLATVAPKLSIPQLIGTVAVSRLVIGGDTGPVHMAWALNRPSVTVFGPTPSFRNTLETGINKTVDTGKTIDPSRLDRHDFSIAEIAPDTIAATAACLLKEPA